MKIRLLFSSIVLLAMMTLFGCGGGGDTPAPAPVPPADSVTISGVAALGPINGGDVKVYAIKDGKVDTSTVLGIGKTAEDGSYTITLSSVPTGPVVVEVTGGTYTDEASGTPDLNLKLKLHAAVSSVIDGSKIAVTPITHLAFMQVEGIGALTPTEIDDANQQIGRFFEVSNIIGSLPFDPTRPAPAGVSNDQRTYSAAVTVFSYMVNDLKGSLPLEDAYGAVLSKLETELSDNGGFSLATINATNKAISSYAASAKNVGGLPLRPVLFSGGVLQLSTAGTLPADTLINGIDISVTLPDGVTAKLDPITGEALPGVVVPTSLAAKNSFVSVKYDKAASVVRIILINVQPGFAVGEFAHLEFNGFPIGGADFSMKVNRIDGSSIPSAPLTGITVTSTFAGL
jgi:hypothetical protein